MKRRVHHRGTETQRRKNPLGQSRLVARHSWISSSRRLGRTRRRISDGGFLLRKQVRRDLLKKQDSSLARSGSRMNKGLGRVDCLRERPQAGSGYAALCSPPLLWPQSSEDPVSHLLGWPSRYVFLGPVEIGISGPDTQVARDTHLLISFKLKQTSPISFCYRRKHGSQSRY